MPYSCTIISCPIRALPDMWDGFAAAHSAHRGIIPYGGMDTANTALTSLLRAVWRFRFSSEVRSFARLISFRYFGFGCADVPEQPRFEDTFRKRFDHIFKVGTEASIASSLSAPSLSDPRYRIRAHAIGSSQESDGFTGRLSPSDFCNLMRREQWFPPHFDPGTFGSFTSFRRPGLDQLSFEFSKTAQHCKHQPSGWRCGIRPRVCQGFEQATTVSNLFHDGQQVDCGPRQAGPTVSRRPQTQAPAP